MVDRNVFCFILCGLMDLEIGFVRFILFGRDGVSLRILGREIDWMEG